MNTSRPRVVNSVRALAGPLAGASVRTFAVFLLLSFASLTAAAQGSHDGGTPAESKGGTAAASTYAPDKLETVNLANGNLSMSLPLATVGGRGSASFSVTLSYNSKVWSSYHTQQPVVKDQFGAVLYPALDHYYARYDDPGVPEPNRIDLSGGWSISLGPAIKIRAVDIDPITPATTCPQSHADDGCGYKYILTKAWLTLPDGSEVELRDNLTDGSPALTSVDGTGYHQHIDRDRGRVWHSADGSFVTFVLDAGQPMVSFGTPSGWVFLADGTRLRMDAGVCTKIIDADGNYITISTTNGVTTYTDELRRQTTVQFANGVATVTATGYGVPDRVITVNTGVIGSNLRADFQSLPRPFTAGDYLRTQGQDDNPHTLPQPHTDLFDQPDHYGQSETEQLGDADVDARTVVTGVQLLDGRNLHFHYNQYGEVAEVVYPGGGVSQIDYQGFTSSLCAGFTQFNYILDRRVVERRLLTDGTNLDATWLYTGSNSSTLATVEARKGDRNGTLLLHENHYFMAPVNSQHMLCSATRQNGTGYETSGNAKENRVERQVGTDAGGQPIYEVTVRNWEQRAAVAWPNDPGLTYNSYAAQHGAAEEDIANDPRVTWEETTLEDGRKKRVEDTYDQFNNVILRKEYDFGDTSGSTGALLRQTVRTYVGDAVQPTNTPSYNGYCYTNLDPTDSTCGGNLASDVTTIIHQRHLLLTEEVLDAAGHRAAYSDREYDNYRDASWAAAPPDVNSRMTMYDGTRFSAFDQTHQPRGNVTRARGWIAGSDDDQTNVCVASVCAASYSRYDNAGQVVAVKDPLGHVSSVSYADDYGDGTSPGGTTVGASGATFAHATSATNALGQVAKTQYDFTRGAATGVRNANNIVTKTEYDQMGRPVRTTAALGLAEQTEADLIYPTASSNVALVSKQLDSTRWLASKTEMDGFDRPVLAASAEDGQKADSASFTIFTTTIYDPLGRVKMVTNPYRSQPSLTDGWDRMTYDLGGRVLEMATFTGSVSMPPPDDTSCTITEGCTGSVNTIYAGEQTTVIDQAGKQHRTMVDGLGRLKSVDEMKEFPSTSVYATTSYGYDALGNLKSVSQNQGQQTRTFAYDGLSRLTSATNPEVCLQGQRQCVPVPITYVYDAGGNLLVKTDARGVSSHYEYDGLNRVTRRWYNGSSDLTKAVNNNPILPQGVGASDEARYFYDSQSSQTLPTGAPTNFDPGMSVGMLVAVTYGGGAQGSYTGQYDAMGRPKASYQVTDTGTSDGVKTYSMAYGYDLAGNLTSETYPSNRKVVTEYDAAGRVAGVQNHDTSLYYAGAAATDSANRVQYTAAGAASQMKIGNGLWEHTDYNSRLQPTQIGLGTSRTDSSTLKLDYTYGVVVSGTLDATKNNGNVQSQKITLPDMTTYVQSYTYDQVNRLWTAEETVGTNSNWKQVYYYDQYGNRNLTSETTYPNYAQTPTVPASDPTIQLPVDPVGNPFIDPADNRISVTATGQGNYQYDAAGNLLCDPGHQCAQGQSSPTPYYAYDAENKMKSAGDVPANGGAAYTYDGDGQRVRKVVGSVATVYVYDAAGKLIAEYGGESPQTTGTSYVTQDTLGSTRVITGQSQTDVRGRYDYLPFGKELYIGRTNYGGGDINQKFTSYDRDNETDLDYAQTRYYSNSQGRFTSADKPFAGQYRANPQSWNMYQYVVNSPLVFIDPMGMAHKNKRGEWVGDTDGEKQGDYVWSNEQHSWVYQGGTLPEATVTVSANTNKQKAKHHTLEVTIFEPLNLADGLHGFGGHIAFNIDGRAWSREIGGWAPHIPWKDYINNNFYRNGVGFVLGDPNNPDWADHFAELIMSYDHTDSFYNYGLLSYNCGEPFAFAVNNTLGLPDEGGSLPAQHESFILTYMKPYIRAVHYYDRRPGVPKTPRQPRGDLLIPGSGRRPGIHY